MYTLLREYKKLKPVMIAMMVMMMMMMAIDAAVIIIAIAILPNQSNESSKFTLSWTD